MKDNKIINALAIVTVVLLVSVIVFVNVSIANKIEEGRYIGKSANFRDTISVSGEGEVFVKPNTALLNLSVVNENVDVQEALSENTRKANNVIDFLKEKGVREEDIKTTFLNVSPRYEYLEGAQYFIPSGKRILVGYEARQSLEVKVRNLEEVGTVVSGAVAAGSNEVFGPNFVIDEEEEFKDEARKIAIDSATKKAQKLADQLGVSLVRIVNFNESDFSPVFRKGGAIPDEALMEVDLAIPDVQAGESSIKVNVNITYEIR